jgi:Recombination endonuclease VII
MKGVSTKPGKTLLDTPKAIADRKRRNASRVEARRRDRQRYPERKAAMIAYQQKWKADNKAWIILSESRRTAAQFGFMPACAGMIDEAALAEVQRWLDKKPIGCEFCGKSSKRLVIDHNHFTGRIRAWLCDHCNGLEGKIACGLVDRLRAFVAERDAT